MRRATLNYQADGLQMKSELFLEPSAQPKPGILVFPEAYGLNKHALSRAEKLAGLGYAALACDLHGQALVGCTPIHPKHALAQSVPCAPSQSDRR